MDYRAVTFSWRPRSQSHWAVFSAARREAARLWADLVERHFRIRKANRKWPSLQRWQSWAKGRYPGLHSQSVQQIIGEFCEAVASAYRLRRNGQVNTKYPWRRDAYRDVIYTNQAVRVKDGNLILPNCKSGDLRVRLPDTVTLPGRIMEVRLKFGDVQIICEVIEAVKPTGPTIGVDLGVNTLLAATDGKRVLLVSGREAKATVQWRAKKLASIEARLSGMHRGSRRRGRLVQRKHKMLRKAANRVKDLTHKATHKVADIFPNAKCYVGKPFNDAAQKMGRKQAQQVSSACNARLIAQLDYKTAGAIQVEEAYSSQTDPVCGARNKCGRVYRCKPCGTTAPRDVIGAVNILCIGECGGMVPGRSVPNAIHWVRPIQVSRRQPSSSRGHRASSLSVLGPQEATGL